MTILLENLPFLLTKETIWLARLTILPTRLAFCPGGQQKDWIYCPHNWLFSCKDLQPYLQDWLIGQPGGNLDWPFDQKDFTLSLKVVQVKLNAPKKPWYVPDRVVSPVSKNVKTKNFHWALLEKKGKMSQKMAKNYHFWTNFDLFL